MEIQALLKKLSNDIEEKSGLLSMAEAEHRDTTKVKMDLEIAIENYSTIFSALPMLM
ncbi:hypothetical protein [Mucilaginibacter arboris]|uniref:Uncharacterized protein n=1 Tax=Mucilaginibacter arboris TaxID=2682090 RepID=A0A7K1T0T0_9SPHI|nr:hypothetical protein [Mucilaginibacter arboris]MVN23182.1 hypothetical protein [Mucilaginibacter arboris]